MAFQKTKFYFKRPFQSRQRVSNGLQIIIKINGGRHILQVGKKQLIKVTVKKMLEKTCR